MSPDILVYGSYLLIGLLAGVIGGLMGLGGGIVIVPALYFLFVWQGFPAEVVMQLAVATSLATIIFTAISSTRAHHLRGAVLWSAVRGLTPGIIIGAVLGGFIVALVPSDTLRVAFGLFEIAVAAQIAFSARPPPQRTLPGRGGQFAAGGLIGSLSTILGIGGGTLTVPFLLWCNTGIHKAVATASACGLPIALVGTITLIISGWQQPDLPADTLGFVYWPAAAAIIVASIIAAPWGVRLAHALPVNILRRVFAVVLALIGLRMILS
jgi:uncharacterized protein